MLVTIILALAAVAVLAAIVVVAIGGGGELSVEHPDHPPLALPGRSVGGTDAALLRLPMGLWGYHKQITDAALERFAHELTERDTRIAVLEQELAEARRRAGGDEEPRPAQRRPAVPSAAPPPDSFGAPETLTDVPARSRGEQLLPRHDQDDDTSAAPGGSGLAAASVQGGAAYADPGDGDEAHEGPGHRDDAADIRVPEPPRTVTDRVVFDPRWVAERDAQSEHEDGR